MHITLHIIVIPPRQITKQKRKHLEFDMFANNDCMDAQEKWSNQNRNQSASDRPRLWRSRANRRRVTHMDSEPVHLVTQACHEHTWNSWLACCSVAHANNIDHKTIAHGCGFNTSNMSCVLMVLIWAFAGKYVLMYYKRTGDLALRQKGGDQLFQASWPQFGSAVW